jgi:hypothetical protein
MQAEVWFRDGHSKTLPVRRCKDGHWLIGGDNPNWRIMRLVRIINSRGRVIGILLPNN